MSSVRPATRDDASAMASLAEAKRSAYATHGHGFQRPAANARELQEPFLADLTERDGFAVFVRDGGAGVDGFLAAQFGGAPPPFGAGAHFHVDDFVVREPKLWPDVGRQLLHEVTRVASSEGFAEAIVVSGPPELDAPKSGFLSSRMDVVARWFVKRIHDGHPDAVEQEGFDAVVGPAPPVYDPGGEVALALRIDEPAAVEWFEHFAAHSGAVLAVIPARVGSDVHEAVANRGYTVASEWFGADAQELLEL